MQPDLSQLLSFLTTTLQQTKDFSIEQAPLFIKELLLWKTVEAIIWAIGLTLLIIIVDVTVEKLFSVVEDSFSKIFTRSVAAICVVITICVNSATVAQIKVAPRLVVIEMVRDIISK